jgi:hypothetical protein
MGRCGTLNFIDIVNRIPVFFPAESARITKDFSVSKIMATNQGRERSGRKSPGIEGVSCVDDAADPIMVAVIEAVSALRDRAKIYALDTLHSEERGDDLLVEAAMLLVRKLQEDPESFPAIVSVQDYLFQVYKQLVLIELRLREREVPEVHASVRPLAVPQLGHLIAPTTFKIILKLKLLLVCFARWAGWLYFVDEHLLDDYIRYHKERIELARYIV